MKQILLSCIICMIVFSYEALPQAPPIRWGNAIGGTNLESCGSMIITADNRFILVGSSHSQNGELSGVTSYGQDDVILVKIKNNGALQWIKKFGGKKIDTGQDIVQTSDGNFVFVGITYSNNFDVSGLHGLNDAWLVKVNSATQNIMWQKCIGGSGADQGLSLALTPDNGFLIGGLSLSTDGDLSSAGNHGQSDYWVIKTDSSGNIQWSKCYGGSEQETCKSVYITSDGGYLIFGDTHSADGDVIGKIGGIDNDDLFLLKLNSIGDIEWSRCIGGSDNDFAGGIMQDLNDNILLTSYSSSTDNEFVGNLGGATGYDAFVIKLDPDGNTIWSKPLGGYEDEICFSEAIQNSDSTYIIPCQSGSNDEFVSGAHYGWDFWIVELSLDGDINWQYCYGGSFQEGPQTCAMDFDGRPTFAGYTRSSDGDVTGYKGNNAYNDIWTIQLDLISLKENANIQLNTITPTIFPNPFNDQLKINYYSESETPAKLFIYDLFGKLLYASELLKGNSSIDVSMLSKGIYQVKIFDDNKQYIFKIIKS